LLTVFQLGYRGCSGTSRCQEEEQVCDPLSERHTSHEVTLLFQPIERRHARSLSHTTSDFYIHYRLYRPSCFPSPPVSRLCPYTYPLRMPTWSISIPVPPCFSSCRSVWRKRWIVPPAEDMSILFPCLYEHVYQSIASQCWRKVRGPACLARIVHGLVIQLIKIVLAGGHRKDLPRTTGPARPYCTFRLWLRPLDAGPQSMLS
jgi:hypothetical protein